MGMKTPDRFAGNRITCSGCKTELIVPAKKAVHTRKEKTECESSKKGRTKKGTEVGTEAESQSEIETCDLESEARAVLREINEAES
jgi:hypothetical protein